MKHLKFLSILSKLRIRILPLAYIGNAKLIKMKYLMTLMALVAAVNAGAQQNPSYDPDWNGDGYYGISDLMGFLSIFGTSVSSPVSGDYDLLDIGPSGGIIFYVDSEDVYEGWDYLEAAPVSIGGHYWGEWGCYIPGADEQEIGYGLQNTIDLVAMYDSCNTEAAMAAWEYEVNGFSDWFLPSLNELLEIYEVLHINGLGLFGNDLYGSSSDATGAAANSAWYVRFSDGAALGWGRSSILVRPIRKF
tara:strand:- start:126 stop:866 length:741 start_codon:yes stop_codon:yes gene_type:complete